MDSIALSLFAQPVAEPAARPVQSGEAPPQGGSLFGALVVAAAKGEDLNVDGAAPTAVAAANDDTPQATTDVPPPFFVREWLAQSDALPVLPKGLVSALEKPREDARVSSALEGAEPGPLDPQHPEDPEIRMRADILADQSNNRAPASTSDIPAEDDQIIAPPASEHHSPRLANSGEVPLEVSADGRTSTETDAESDTLAMLVHYVADSGSSAPSGKSGGRIDDAVDPATGLDPVDSAPSDLQSLGRTARPKQTTSVDSTKPAQSSADTSSDIRPFVGTMTDERTPEASARPKTLRSPDSPKSMHAGTPPAMTGTAEPAPPPSAGTPATNPPVANSDVVAALPQTANISAATDGSADATVRLAPSARNEQTSEMESLALHIAARSARGDSRFTIRLDPPELGRIDVNLSMSSHGHAQAVLAVEKPQTLELLLRDAPGLERALKDAGIDLGSNLSFSLKDEGRQTFSREDSQGFRSRTIEVVASDKANALAALNTPLLQQLYGSRAARLDITV